MSKWSVCHTLNDTKYNHFLWVLGDCEHMSKGPYLKDPLFPLRIFSLRTRRGENGKKNRCEPWKRVCTKILGDIDAREINLLHTNSTVDTIPKLQVEKESCKH